MASIRLKKAGHANRDCRHTFIKQFTFYILVNPLLGFSNLVMEKSISLVSFSKTSFLILTYPWTWLLMMTFFVTTPFFLFFCESMLPRSMQSQSFASWVGSNALWMIFTSFFSSSASFSLGSFYCALSLLLSFVAVSFGWKLLLS